MRNVDLHRMIKRLVNDAITFCQTKQGSELFFAGVSIQIELQTNLLEADRHILGDPESAAKIEIAFGANRCVAQVDTESGGDCAQA